MHLVLGASVHTFRYNDVFLSMWVHVYNAAGTIVGKLKDLPMQSAKLKIIIHVANLNTFENFLHVHVYNL